MDYQQILNNLSSTASVAEQIKKIYAWQISKHIPYQTEAPDGHLDGPNEIRNTDQEVTSTASPIYSNSLSGYYHLNK